MLILAVACTPSEQHDGVRLHGPLAGLLEQVPVSLAGCTPSPKEFSPALWHAPYLVCGDSLPAGRQAFEVDSDSFVVSESRDWRVPFDSRDAAWARAAHIVQSRFGTPVRGQLTLREFPEARTRESPRSYCALWRGPDSVEIALYLQPTSDVGSSVDTLPWELRRYARYGPLPGAVSCGARF